MPGEGEKTNPSALSRLRTLGFQNQKERRTYLDAHEEEIKADAGTLGRAAAIKKWRLGASTTKRILRSTGPRRKSVSKASKPTQINGGNGVEKFLETLPPDLDVGQFIAVIIDKLVKNNNLQELQIEGLEKQLKDSEGKVSELKKQLAALEIEKKKVMENANEIIARAKLPRKISLFDLQHAMGKGPDGTRRSFQP